MQLERLVTALPAACERFAVPGAQVGLLRDGERAVLCAGTRAAGGAAPVERSTPFHAGSLAKSLAALVVVDAARRGELDIDVPCDEQAAGTWSDTPRALMAHTSGRPNELPGYDEDIEAFVARVGAQPRVHEPGRFSYGNAGWSVLDLLLRRRCGASFEELAIERVLGAAGTFGQPADAALGHAVAADGAIVEVPGDAAVAASAAGSRWWATADQLLDHAALHLGTGPSAAVAPADLLELRRRHVDVPGATVADGWGLGWALWDRGDHHAFGWAGFTGGHRAYLRCFPDHGAAVVVLANSAGPLFTAPGGSALFDALLPDALLALDLPPLPAPALVGAGRPAADLAGSYGPVGVAADGPDAVVVDAAAFGAPTPLRFVRRGADSFVTPGEPPGSMAIAFDRDLLYVGPFALPRNDP